MLQLYVITPEKEWTNEKEQSQSINYSLFITNCKLYMFLVHGY